MPDVQLAATTEFGSPSQVQKSPESPRLEVEAPLSKSRDERVETDDRAVPLPSRPSDLDLGAGHEAGPSSTTQGGQRLGQTPESLLIRG